MRDPLQQTVSMMRRSPGEHFCISTKSSTGKWKDNFFKRKELGRIPDFIKSHKASDVYMCPQGFSEARRHKDFALDPYTLFADLDECDPRKLDIKPTVAIESSPGRWVAWWYTDGPITEDLNRRMSYHCGADVSGWDYTQVLRVPGTRNHKYDNKPEVRVLWTDGPRYQADRLQKLIPRLETDDGRERGGEAQEIYERYEKDLPRLTRRELTNPKVQQGKRSEVIWKLINDLVEVGMARDEIFTLLWDNDWNKFAERRGGERMLERQIDKALGGHVGGSHKIKDKKKVRLKPSPSTDGAFFNLVPMSEVEAENPDWLVPGMIARGETTIIEGDPGVGKSYFLMWLCVHWCDGLKLPWDNTKAKAKPLKIAYCDTENAMGVVTKSRLTDNGLKNFHNYLQIPETFSLQDEDAVKAIEEELIKDSGIDVLIIDPVTPYLGNADSHNAKEVRQTLDEINTLAKKYRIAFIIVRHLNKSKGGKALYAGGGSIGFSGLARVVATIGWHPDEPGVRVVACTKNNLSLPFGSLGYSIEPLPDLMDRENRSELVYEGRVEYSSDDIIDTSNVKEDNSQVIAADLIRESMASEGEEINYHRLIKQADTRSISERAIKKAAAELGLRRITRGRGKKRETLLVPQRSTD